MNKLNYGNFNFLITSNQGIHLSAYIKNTHEIKSIKDKIRETIINSSYHLQNALTPDEMIRFLGPLETLAEDDKTLELLKENFALFRTKTSFKILSIPTSFKEICVVADTFHVKPILKWLQNDSRFTILGVTKSYINFYKASNNSSPTLIANIKGNQKELEYFLEHNADEWFKEVIQENPGLQGQDVYITGSPRLCKKMLDNLTYQFRYHHTKYQAFSHRYINRIIASISLLRRDKIQQDYFQSLREYYYAKDQNLAQNNIYDIAKSAIEGRIKKLIIRDGINLFGKICKTSGDLSIHHTELNHEDDDLLDDLAQTVLLHGGEVFITDEKESLPERFPIAAILERDDLPKPNFQVPKYISSHHIEVA